MERKVESGIECIEMADRLFSQYRKEYKDLQKNKKDMSSKELNNNERLLGAQFGLICEYYLKGLLLPYIKLVVPEDTPELQVIVDNLTPEQEYKILIGDNRIKNELSTKFNIPAKKINKLMEQSLKKIGGNGHDLSSFIGTQFMQDNKDIKLPPDVRNEIYKGMATYFSKIFTPNNNEEWKEFLKAFYVIDDLSENTFTYETDFEHTISDSSVSDAFFSGRYGHLENYIPNLDALYNLAYSIRNSVKQYYFNAISISNGYITGSLRYIFPDQNSKIYVFDEKNELTRVYTLENDIDFLSKQFEKSLNDDKNEEHKKLSICPEFGVKKIKEIEGHFFKNRDDLLLPTDYLLVKNGTESIIICKIDNQLKGYIYKNGIIFESNEEILPKYSQLINKYEIERKNGKYAEETQMIKESILDEKGLKKQSKEYKRYLDYRLSTNVYAYKKRTLKLIRYASLSLKGAKVFRGNIGKKLLDNTNSLLGSAQKEIDLFAFFSENEMKRINEERETDYLKFRRDVETEFTDKLVNLYILENNLGNEELLEAIKDKYGIGKAIISKIKGLFKGKGESER